MWPHCTLGIHILSVSGVLAGSGRGQLRVSPCLPASLDRFIDSLCECTHKCPYITAYTAISLSKLLSSSTCTGVIPHRSDPSGLSIALLLQPSFTCTRYHSTHCITSTPFLRKKTKTVSPGLRHRSPSCLGSEGDEGGARCEHPHLCHKVSRADFAVVLIP